MVKRLALCMVAVLLVASLVMVGCSEEEKAEGTWDLELWSGQAGAGTVYVTSFAIADALNENQPNITASCVESLGGFDNVFSTADFSTERKENLIFGLPLPSLEVAKEGVEPWVDKAYDVMAIGTVVMACGFFVTLDPDITEAADLEGKTIGNYPKGSVTSAALDGILYGGLGPDFEDKVNIEYMSPTQIYADFLDGKLDAVFVVLSWVPDTQSWMVVAPLTQLLAVKGSAVHPIQFTESEYEAGFEYAKQIASPTLVPADTLYDGSEELWAMGSAVCSYCCWPEADEDLVYEFTKYIYENADVIAEYGGAAAAVTEEYMTLGLEDNEEWVHPGALKYYKEKGLM